jgi:hypothetical protein
MLFLIWRKQGRGEVEASALFSSLALCAPEVAAGPKARASARRALPPLFKKMEKIQINSFTIWI